MADLANHDAEVKQLRDDLFRVRNEIIGLAPMGTQSILRQGITCTTPDELEIWENAIVRAMVAIVPSDQRVACPLCRETVAVGLGYAQHELGRHLKGQDELDSCPVMEAAVGNARDGIATRGS